MQRQFSQVANFLMIYISEAHASDEWPIGRTISCVKQPTSIEERFENAVKFINEFQIDFPVVLDSIENHFDSSFSAWPMRSFVLSVDSKLLYKTQPNILDKNNLENDLLAINKILSTD